MANWRKSRKYRKPIKILAAAVFVMLLSDGCAKPHAAEETNFGKNLAVEKGNEQREDNNRMSDQKVVKSEDAWKKELQPQEYAITRCGATEPAFTGKYYDCHTPGVYHCTCCGAELFSSKNKFDSGTGWPSFYQPANQKSVETKDDFAFGMKRTEVLCSKCDAHLGHVFEDGPAPTNLRYCINSASLKLEPDDKESK